MGWRDEQVRPLIPARLVLLRHMPGELHSIQLSAFLKNPAYGVPIGSAAQQYKGKGIVLSRSQNESPDQYIHAVSRLPTAIAQD